MALNPRNCTCGGAAEGWPQHEPMCGSDYDEDRAAGNYPVREYDRTASVWDDDPWLAADRAFEVDR